MKPFSDLTAGEKSVEFIRWLSVLPAALLGALAVQLIVGGFLQLADYGGWGLRGNSNIAFWTGILLVYVPRESAFVIAGTKLAPRHQVATACGLAALGIGLSLLKHLVLQYLAGNRVGIVNAIHFCAESVGLLGGAAYILWQSSAQRAKHVEGASRS